MNSFLILCFGISYFLESLLNICSCSIIESKPYISQGNGLNPELTSVVVDSVTLSGILQCASYCSTQNCRACFYDDGTSTCSLFSKYIPAVGTNADSRTFYIKPPVCPDDLSTYSCLENVARDKTVSTSSVSHSVAQPTVLVDGIISHTFPACTHTYNELNPWLLTNLGQSCVVWEIRLYNRLDCCAERFKNVVVSLGEDSANLTPVYYHAGTVSDPILYVELHYPISAQFVEIMLNSTTADALSICEMIVLGHA